jgi:putative membrane protein
MSLPERQTDGAPGRRAASKAFTAIGIFLGLIVLLYVTQRDMFELWMKALHVIAVMSWMAGLLYLPRLFIYHTDAEPGSVQSETFKVMEGRLLKVIMNPAMVISWGLGLYLAWVTYGFHGGWLHIKIMLVLILTGVHFLFARAVKRFAQDGPRETARYWRGMNELPTVLMIAIVIFVIVKPFS